MDVCSPLVPDAQSAEAVQPTQGSLDEPTPPSKLFARLYTIARDASGDAPTAQPSPMGSRSVRSVSMQLTWAFAGTASQPFHCRDRLYQRDEETRVMYLGARHLSHQRKHTPIDQQMVFASKFAAIGWVSACVLAPGRCRYACSVNASSIPHYLVVLSEPSKNRRVDTLPNAG